VLEYTKLTKWPNGVCTRMLMLKSKNYIYNYQLGVKPCEFHNMILCNRIHKIVTNQFAKAVSLMP